MNEYVYLLKVPINVPLAWLMAIKNLLKGGSLEEV